MPKNLEVKARIQNVSEAIKVAHSISATYAGELLQTDTYFHVVKGRLKLREIDNTNSELIYYNRSEEMSDRISNFDIFPCQYSNQLKLMLEKGLGIKAIVQKKRKLFMYQNTRIHIDDVRHLGMFIEIESPVESSIEPAKKIVDFLVKKFSIDESQVILNSYLDLVLNT
jgi:adenylate cyclase, class 2